MWGWTGCVDAPSFPSAPIINDVRLELGSSPVVPGDTGSFVRILIDFTDGDGDIGHNTADSITDLFLINEQIYYYDDSLEMFDTTRIDTLTNSYLIPIIPPNGGVPDISGTIRINVLDPVKSPMAFAGYCAVSNNSPQGIVDGPLTAIKYKVWFMDRAGNRTEVVSVPGIPIDCE